MEQSLSKPGARVIALYKDASGFLSVWSPANQAYCHNNLAKSTNTPTVNEVRICFGEDFITRFVCGMISNLIVFRGEEDAMDDAEIAMCASLIVNNHNLCVLNTAFFLNFFFEMKCGKYKVFGKLTPGKLMECYQEYFQWAFEKQNYYYDEEEKRKRREQMEKDMEEARLMRERVKKGEIPAPKMIDYEKIGIRVNEVLKK